MAGLGKFLKEAQKMQKQLESMQVQLSQQTFEVAQGGGAVKITINGQGTIQKLVLDPDFLKEDAGFVQETLLAAIQEAQSQAKALNDQEMGRLAGGLPGIPGLMG